jgi:hypothetical protein
MQHSAKIRFIAAAAFAFAALLSAQTPPPTPAAPLPLLPSQQPPHRAEVTYTDGKLLISASNSSLNQILHEISRQTSMKITGGVTDERVFGQYGPDIPSKILTLLLDGTGSNMLLLQATTTAPAELILTPRQGGPTPPNPNASQDDAADVPPSRPQYPISNQPQGNTPPFGSGQSQSPNAVRTPQQIYEQLQRMRQQQQQQPQQQQPPP